MNADQTNIIRRKIIQLSIGSQTTVAITGLANADIQAEATRFCKIKKLPCTFTPTDAGLVIKRVAADPRANLYPQIDALEVGQSHVFDLPLAFHQRIRMAASARGSQGRGAFSCSREGDALRVTRLPATDAERAACGPLQVPARSTKYDLERLSSTRELRFTVPRADEAKLRLAAHRQGIKTGWPIRCRRQDDGSMLIYRTDMPVAEAGSDSTKP